MDEEGNFFDERGDYRVREAKGGQVQPNQSSQPANPNTDYHYSQSVAGRPVYVQGPPPPPPPVDAARTPGVQPSRRPVETFDEELFESSFNTTEIRHRFVRKVYLLLTVLLVVTSGVIAIFVFEENTNKFARENPLIGLILSIVYLVVLIAMRCSTTLMRRVPINLVVLGIFTAIGSVHFGFIAALYSPDIVLYSAGITTGLCLLITLVACQTWFDITGCGVYLCIFGMVFMLFAMVVMVLALTTGISNTLFLVYSCIAGLLIGMYFMYTTQLILGGKRYEMSPEEYIFAVVMLYVEILTMFVIIMSCFRR